MIFKRAEQYVWEYRRKERDVIRLKREARKHGNFYIGDEPKLAIVIRLKGQVADYMIFYKHSCMTSFAEFEGMLNAEGIDHYFSLKDFFLFLSRADHHTK